MILENGYQIISGILCWVELTQGFFSPERKGKKNSAVSRKRRKRKFLQVSLLKKCKVGVRRDRTYKLCILSGKLDRLKSHALYRTII